VQTKKVGLIEPGIGSALTGDQMGTTFQEKVTRYLADIGQSGDGVVTVQGANGQTYDGSAGERSLDVSIVTAINPNSDLALFVGSGRGATNGAEASTYTAIQSATFPGVGVEKVSAWSDSFGDLQSMSPHSPFYRAYWELYVDTVLANQTAVTALGDGGSSEEIGNGLTNLQYNCTQPFSLLVGGTSLSSMASAQLDPTLVNSIVAPALAGDKATIWQLVIGGLTHPAVQHVEQPIPVLPRNAMELLQRRRHRDRRHDDLSRRLHEEHGDQRRRRSDPAGAVYQVAYGLNPVTSDPLAQVGRGAPDVTANAGGNATYQLAGADMVFSGATSSAPAPPRRSGPR
jgi:hypothetical protein